MKEFTTAVEDIVAEDEREEKIVALIAEGKTRAEAEAEVDDEQPIEFDIVDKEWQGEGDERKYVEIARRTLHAYPPTDGQLAFMLASMGRGQTADGRFASIINIMLECLRDDDKDWFESRLLSRDKKKRIGVKTIEGVFEMLTEEWFARPTQ